MTQKEKTFLDQTAQRLHLTVDGESSILFGSVGGYQTMLWRNDQGLAVMTLSLHSWGRSRISPPSGNSSRGPVW